MYKLIFCALFVGSSSYVKEESNDVISTTVESIAMRDYGEKLTLDAFFIKLKNIEISNFKTLRNAGKSTWLKDYSEEGSNFDYMNLTLKLENMSVSIAEITVGPTKFSASFDIGENEARVRMSSRGYVSPGVCHIKIEDFEVTKLNKVIMHSDVTEYEGRDVSSFFQDLALPLVNRIVKSPWLEEYMQAIAGQFCDIAATSNANKVVDS